MIPLMLLISLGAGCILGSGFAEFLVYLWETEKSSQAIKLTKAKQVRNSHIRLAYLIFAVFLFSGLLLSVIILNSSIWITYGSYLTWSNTETFGDVIRETLLFGPLFVIPNAIASILGSLITIYACLIGRCCMRICLRQSKRFWV